MPLFFRLIAVTKYRDIWRAGQKEYMPRKCIQNSNQEV